MVTLLTVMIELELFISPAVGVEGGKDNNLSFNCLCCIFLNTQPQTHPNHDECFSLPMEGMGNGGK